MAYFYTAYGLQFRSDLLLPECLPGTGENIDFEIVLTSFPGVKSRPTNIYRRGIRATSGTDAAGHLYLSWEGVADYQALNGRTLRVQPRTEEADLLSLFTLSEALGLILFQRGMYLLHASAVQVGAEAWCFMGTPGAGKSTTAAAFVQAGCPLLSDDLTALRFDEQGRAQIIPGFPQLKIWDTTAEGLRYDPALLTPISEGINKFAFQPTANFPQVPIELGAIYFLHRARNRPARQVVSPVEVPMETLKYFPLPKQFLNQPTIKKLFTQSLQCARTVPICRMRRPADFAALQAWVALSVEASKPLVV
ncbi:hypothetical protein HNQ92_000919 [Rhabdobacter roseus]|uniref:Serine kinase n=1 Tax=Rhabdobacter roseus TaxID=1655419 RepID=A0A840TS59_9BACT|nr:serine kinase [Rhabdobacter roseus]MBB5282798.1 hypothetical protein [Rhabdobacter roseus]